MLAVACGAYLIWQWRTTSPSPPPAPRVGAEVVSVADGDTLTVRDAAETYTVRLIGVNAPELAHFGAPAECFGAEARAELRRLLTGRTVSVVADPALPAVDRYDRRLAYVEVDGTDVGQAMIAGGFAVRYELRSQATPQRSAAYLAAEQRAEAARTGLWGACPAPPARHS